MLFNVYSLDYRSNEEEFSKLLLFILGLGNSKC